MDKRRRSPAQYRKKSTAVAWFCVCIMLMIAAGALVYVFVINYDFGGFIPDDGSMREFIPEKGYERIPRQEVEATATPIPQPTPLPTPLPLDKYSLRDTRVSLPTGYDVALGDLTQFYVSEPDDNEAFVVHGWAYIEDMDAAQSTIYLAVLPKYGVDNRFYSVFVESGSTGIVHDPATGSNLDRADFRAAVSVETFADGEYKLGIVVHNGQGSNSVVEAYCSLDEKYNFVVEGGKIVG